MPKKNQIYKKNGIAPGIKTYVNVKFAILKNKNYLKIKFMTEIIDNKELKKEQTGIKKNKGPILNLSINLGLLVFALVMVFSGLYTQINFHMRHHGGNAGGSAFCLNYYGWSSIHKISAVIVTALMLVHFVTHWKCYKTIIKKKLFAKNRQVIILTLIFIIVAITGYIPWLIKATGRIGITGKIILEIHDKLALVLLIYLILHVVKRFNWYKKAYKQCRNTK